MIETLSALEVGDIEYHNAFFARHSSELNEVNQTTSQPFMLTGLYHAKIQPIEALYSEDPKTRSYSLSAIRCAIIEESQRAIGFVCKRFIGRGQHQIPKDFLSAQHVLALQKAHKGEKDGVDSFEAFAHSERFRDRVPSHLINIV